MRTRLNLKKPLLLIVLFAPNLLLAQALPLGLVAEGVPLLLAELCASG